MAMKAHIERWTLDDLDISPESAGLEAAKVKISDINPSKKTRLNIQMFFNEYQDGDFDGILNEVQRIK